MTGGALTLATDAIQARHPIRAEMGPGSWTVLAHDAPHLTTVIDGRGVVTIDGIEVVMNGMLAEECLDLFYGDGTRERVRGFPVLDLT